MRDFSKKVRKLIDSFLGDRGFVYSDRYYKSEQSNGVRLMIAFDNGGIDSNSFNIMILVNSVELDSDKGAHCICYFTGGSLSPTARKLPCHDDKSLDDRLKRFIEQYDSVISPYFSSFSNCSDIAKKLEYDVGLSSYQGDLFFLAGEKRNAKRAYKAWIEHLPTLKRLNKNQIDDEIDTTRKKIKKCSLFSRA